jgi:hypothetical protein
MIGAKDGRASAGFAVTPRDVAQCPARYMFLAGPGFDCCDAQLASEMGAG